MCFLLHFTTHQDKATSHIPPSPSPKPPPSLTPPPPPPPPTPYLSHTTVQASVLLSLTHCFPNTVFLSLTVFLIYTRSLTHSVSIICPFVSQAFCLFPLSLCFFVDLKAFTSTQSFSPLFFCCLRICIDFSVHEYSGRCCHASFYSVFCHFRCSV